MTDLTNNKIATYTEFFTDSFLILGLSAHTHQIKQDSLSSHSSSFSSKGEEHLVIRLKTVPWTHEEIVELQNFLKVTNILDTNTIIDVLLTTKCDSLQKERYSLYQVFVKVVERYFIPYVKNKHIIDIFPLLSYGALNAVLMAGANPQPHFKNWHLWDSLQYYMMGGKNEVPEIELLFKFGAQPDFIANKLFSVPALDFEIWQFFVNGRTFVKLLLDHKADPNMPCPVTLYPDTLEGEGYPRRLFIGFFTGKVPLVNILGSKLEQLYYYYVFDPQPGKFNRRMLAAQSEAVADLLINYGATPLQKLTLEAELERVIDRLVQIFKHPANESIKHAITTIVNKFGH